MILRKNPVQRHRAIEAIDAQLRNLPLTREWVVDIREFRKTRSDNQSRYLFGVVYKAIADFTGSTTEEVHEFLAHKFLSLGESNGIPRRQSTTKLSTVDFETYCERLRAWAASECGIVIPLPNEYDA